MKCHSFFVRMMLEEVRDMKIVFPDYNNSLTNLSNSILKYFGIDTYHSTISEVDAILEEKHYQNVVLLLYDGMSSSLMKKNLGDDSFLNSHKMKDISSVFPPTTTAATTSVLSGLNPNEHGWLGWDLYFKELDETVTMFLNTKKDRDERIADESVAEKYYPYQSIIELINETTKAKAYYLKPFGNDGYKTLEEMHQKICELCKTNERKFIYAYWDEPDHTMHDVGTNAEEVIELFKEIDVKTKTLCEKLEDTLVIVIADHGHLNCESITLQDYPDIWSLLRQDISIEGRACAFFIKEGRQKEFEELFQKYFGEYFYLYSKKEVMEQNLFGVGMNHAYFADSLGDYLAVAVENKYFRYDENSIELYSMHAGLTEDEMMVPLITYEAGRKVKKYEL